MEVTVRRKNLWIQDMLENKMEREEGGFPVAQPEDEELIL